MNEVEGGERGCVAAGRGVCGGDIGGGGSRGGSERGAEALEGGGNVNGDWDREGGCGDEGFRTADPIEGLGEWLPVSFGGIAGDNERIGGEIGFGDRGGGSDSGSGELLCAKC